MVNKSKMKDITENKGNASIPVAESNYRLSLEITYDISDQMVLPYPSPLLPLSLAYDIILYTNLARVC